MTRNVLDFLDGRIEDISQNLLKTNSEYALSVEKSKTLLENIDPIIHNDGDITISGGDCIDFREFLEHEFTATAIMQQELYKQGYLDCVKLLEILGAI